MRLLSRLILLLLFPAFAKAGTPDNSYLGIKSSALGGSITAFGLDGSAAFYNPAAMAFLTKNYINLGLNISSPKSIFLMNTGEKYLSNNKSKTPISAYGVYKFTDKVDLGLVINNPFQNNISWDENWAGKYICTSFESNVLNIQPAISYRLKKNLSVGGGLMFTRYKQQSAKALNYLGPNGSAMVNYDLSAISFGLNVGVNYNNKQWKLGFSLRSGLSYNAKGDATVSNAPGFFIDNGTLPGSAVNATSKIKLPAVISMGAAYQLDQDWTITADLNIYNWGKIDSILVETENYNSCNLNIRQDLAGSYAMRMGASYNFSKKIIFRGGMAFDLSPVLDTYVHPAFPTYNKFTYTAGGSYKLKNNFSADAFVGYSAIKERKEVKNINNFNGTYKSNMFIGGIGLNYEF